jgi:hypothetical protein
VVSRLEYNSGLSFIAVELAGRIDGKDLRRITAEAITLGQQRGCLRYLVNAMNLELAATTFDIYDMPHRQYDELHLDRRTRIALVLPTLLREFEFARFYEIQCTNRGWNVKSFPVTDEAFKWLMGAESSPASTVDPA